MKKPILFASCFLIMFSLQVKSQLTSEIVGYWKLDETSGEAIDATGSYNGTVNGATVGQTGILNYAYSFDETNDYVSISNSDALNIQTDDIALSAWIYPTANKTQMIISKIHAVGTHVTPYFQYNLQLYYSGTKLYPRFYLSIGGTANFTANTTYNLSLNQWYHVVGTYDGTTMRLYLNGTQISTKATTGNITGYDTPVYIGINGALGEAYGGLIDEVGIWSRALTASEVSELYNSGTGLSYPFNSTYYSFTAVASPTDGGTVTMSPSGGSYLAGTNVTVTATANSGYTFVGWDGSDMTNPKTVTVNANQGITAVFMSGTLYTLTTNCSPEAGGTISVSPSGTGGATQRYMPGTSVSVTANPNPGYTFSGWSGALSSSTNPGSVTMSSNKTLTATFTAIPVTGIELSLGEITILVNDSYQLPASVIPSNAANQLINYSSGNTSVATVDANGLVTGCSVGEAIITAETDDGGFTAQCTIHVVASVPLTWAKIGDAIYYTNGNVGIGTTIPSELLTVNGKILAKEVEVVSSIESDYVFEPEYQLMPLTDLELYIRKNKHLPNIPSALEFAKTGQNLGEMQDLLLRKIEELTLYIIELEKIIYEQGNINSMQNKIIEELRKEIELLKTMNK